MVLFCGAGVPGHPSEARQMAELWDGPAIFPLLDERSRNTAENIDEVAAWSRALHIDELVVVSSWWHLRLWLHYRARRFRGMRTRYVPTWRCHRVLRHLVNELWSLARRSANERDEHR
jgi:uncharacterized SAM-binding protein YcdF (DUF218 family)